ncbi:MAG TPA: efflux RND transporter periplasmic adaptor subunit [Candidatus Solibacter sp.]|nr:efflux RND transporter periplasmic adaptor subunit [Candidatus Solibacter sp.]
MKSFERVALLLFLLPAALVLGGCGTKVESKAPPPAPMVEVTDAVASDADIYTEYPAQTYARDMVDVRGRVEGYIEKWLFRPGQEVTAGQPLYVLDLRPLQAQVQTAQGNVKQSEADLEFARNQVSLRQAEANLAAAQATLIKARQDYERLKPLVEQDAAAKQDLDAATAALSAAEAQVRAYTANVDQTRLTTETQVQSTEGKVHSQRGSLQTAELNLQYGTIKAPITGLIGDTLVPVGGLVTPNATQPLTTIVPLDPIWVRFKVSEAQYLALKGGPAKQAPALELVLADNSRFPQAGKITNTLNQVDPRTGTLEVQAEFPNPQHKLLPGQFGRVRYVADHRTGVILIPQRAIQQNQSLQSVYTVNASNVVEARPVKTGPRVGDSWLIEQGLKPGDRVIVEGLLIARPGATVNPQPYREKPVPGGPGVKKAE